LAVLCMTIPASAETKLVTSEVSTSGAAVFMNGDDDQFRQRHGLPPDFTGGVENLRMEWSVGDDSTATLEGRTMVDSGDYLGHLKLVTTDKGYIDAGYRQFRTWYDGTGGYFHNGATRTIFHYFDEDLRLDRGEGWVELGLRMPQVPELTLRYAHLLRNGQKNSVIWGDSNQTGGLGTRSIVPAFRDIDEDRDLVDFDLKHRLLGSSVGAAFLYEHSDVDDSLNFRRTPGEPSDRYVTQREDVSSNVFGGHAFTMTPLLDNRIVISTSYGYTDLDSDLGGSRIYGSAFFAPFDPAYATRQPLDQGFLNLDGSTQLKQHVGTLTVQTRITKQLQLTAGGRLGQEDADGDSNYDQTDVGFPPTLPTTQTPFATKSGTSTTNFTGDLELRYSGWENWVWTVFGQWDDINGELNEKQTDVSTGTTLLDRQTDIDRFGQKYGVGAAWYPWRRVSLTSRYTYKLHEYDYDHQTDSTANGGADRYPAYIVSQDIRTHAVDARISYRVLDNLRLTARYDGAFQKFDQRSDGLDDVDSAKVDMNAVGTGTTWNPTAGSYVQGDVNYVISRTRAPIDELTGAAAGVAAQDFDNNYWTATVTTGLALTEKIDVGTQYFYYRADNYDNVSATTQPYGANASEHGASAHIALRTSEHLRWRLAYAYFTNDEETTGGANDYDASVITAGVDMTY
jgi:hypothetical protein